jgi:hypothetical protein
LAHAKKLAKRYGANWHVVDLGYEPLTIFTESLSEAQIEQAKLNCDDALVKRNQLIYRRRMRSGAGQPAMGWFSLSRVFIAHPGIPLAPNTLSG